MQECCGCLAAAKVVKPAAAVHVHSDTVTRCPSDELRIAQPLPLQPEPARQCLCAEIDEPVPPIATGLDEQECTIAKLAQRFRERLLVRSRNGAAVIAEKERVTSDADWSGA